MNKQQELDLKVAYSNIARAIEEIIFCTIYPQITGPNRRDNAIKTFAEANIRVEIIKNQI